MHAGRVDKVIIYSSIDYSYQISPFLLDSLPLSNSLLLPQFNELSADRQIIILHWVSRTRHLFPGEDGKRKRRLKARRGKGRHQFIINAELNPVSGCFRVCLGISHPPRYILHFPVCSANFFREYYGPLPSGKPITPSTKLYLWWYSLTFYTLRACACG